MKGGAMRAIFKFMSLEPFPSGERCCGHFPCCPTLGQIPSNDVQPTIVYCNCEMNVDLDSTRTSLKK
jgi:hypothetical protein